MSTIDKAETLMKQLETAMHNGGSTEHFHLARDIVGDLKSKTGFHAGAVIGLATTIFLGGTIYGRHQERLANERGEERDYTPHR